MAVNDVERQKAIVLANYIHCSVHEWPTEDDVPLLCYALLHEVDQNGELRAQLAAAKKHAEYQDKEIRQWANVCYVGTWPLSEDDTKNTGFYGRMAAKMTAERNAATARAEKAEAERDTLAARVAELEGAGKALVERWDTPTWKDVQHTGQFIDALRLALARTPAQSLASCKAAALREAAKECIWCNLTGRYYASKEMLEGMAERLEAEAANGPQ